MSQQVFHLLNAVALACQLMSGSLSAWTARRWRNMGYEGLANFNTGLAIFMLSLAAMSPLLH